MSLKFRVILPLTRPRIFNMGIQVSFFVLFMTRVCYDFNRMEGIAKVVEEKSHEIVDNI